ncbi:MAG: glycosyltransferase family 4 protein, partial [Candidatus Magasanikbacteria bacterium]|nr:glycosyltransferase family 4 protein [Candidatus Magasanikbacteria bacterium]
VRFLGKVPHNEVVPFYYIADIFTLLTHPDEGKEEGLGLVFLEAAAAGLPVVAGKSGGVPEAVIHTQTGLIVDIYHGDNVVVDAITELLTNKEYADRLGKNAQERMKADFNWQYQMEKIKPWIE